MTHPSTPQEQLAFLIEATAQLLHQATPIDPAALLGFVAGEVHVQNGYEAILTDLVTPASRTSHPYWGFAIAGVNPQTQERVEIARTVVPKMLDPKHPEYLAQLAGWTNTYMLTITPAARAAWRALGFQVSFFQSAAPPKSHGDVATKPNLVLVK